MTVDFYRDLPTHGYEVIVFRTHAGGVKEVNEFGATVRTTGAALFTTEPYDRWSHPDEQRALDLVSRGYYRDTPEDEYFAILPKFVASSMEGDFDGAAVILMGCKVLGDTDLARAFVARGAGAVVGWDETVSASHTDAATLNMLQHFVTEDLSLEAAAGAAASEVGPDPFYGSALVSYLHDQ